MMFVGMVVVVMMFVVVRGLHDGDARGRELHGHDDDRGHAHGAAFFGIGPGLRPDTDLDRPLSHQ